VIKAKDAIKIARSLIGTPYKELDCINLIKKVIRTAPGGMPNYTTAGTNTLWRSYDSSPKYRDLTWRQMGIAGAEAGMIAFKATGNDWHHAGIVTGEGTVVHSSSTQGGRGVVETPLLGSEGWTHLAVHKHIEPEEGAAEGQETAVEAYKAKVTLNSGVLNVRNEPGEGGDIIGRLNDGATVEVQTEYDNGWKFVTYGDSGSGYVSGRYIERVEETEEPVGRVQLVLTDSEGNTWMPVGEYTAELRTVSD